MLVNIKLSEVQIDTLKFAVDHDGLVPMLYTKNRTIKILNEHGLIEERLEFDTETESRALEECIEKAKILLQGEDWKEARHLLNEAFRHSENSERTAWFITDTGRDFLRKQKSLNIKEKI